MTENNARFWPDGTPKSQDNAFTNHNYVPGQAVAPTPQKPRHVKGGFGSNNGTIPGMGVPAWQTIKRRA